MTDNQKLYIARSYLYQPQRAEEEVKRLIAARDALYEEAVSPRSATYGVDGNSGGTLRQDAYIVKLEKIETDLAKAIDRWLKLMEYEGREINGLGDRDGDILYARYIVGLSLKEMEPIIKLEKRALIRNCNRALLRFFDLYLDRNDEPDDLPEGDVNYEE